MGIRYIDDVRLIVLALSNSNENISIAQQQIQAFIDNLPKSLILEPEPNEDNSFRFLESHITFKDRDWKISYYSKNYEHGTLIPSTLATYPFQTYLGSYMMDSSQEIKNNIRNRLEAIERYSCNEHAIHIAMISSLGDFYCSNFPRNIILQSIFSYINTISFRKNDWIKSYKFYYKNYPHKSYFTTPTPMP